jgi:nitrite reductase (NO-forming)
MKKLLLSSMIAVAGFSAGFALAETVKVDITVKEKDVVVDNAGTIHPMWTYNGEIPGPLVRVKQGDLVDFSLTNDPENKQSHSIDFHAARVDVLDEFESIKPGKTKDFTFRADYPGVFIYHCGSDSMAEHISRGMYGVIIVDPKEGYSKNFPKPDREYVLVQGDLFEPGTSSDDIKMGTGGRAFSSMESNFITTLYTIPMLRKLLNQNLEKGSGFILSMQ